MNAFHLLSRRLQSLNLVAEIEALMSEDEGLLLELMKDQLFAGLDGDGNPLRPTYQEDPYFTSRAAAQRYSDWKDTMFQRTHNDLFTRRPPGTPNLIITGGLFYDTLVSEVGNSALVVRSDSPIIGKLEGKYGDALLRMSPMALKFYTEERLFIRLQKKVHDYLSR